MKLQKHKIKNSIVIAAGILLLALSGIITSCKSETPETKFGYIAGIVGKEIKADWKATLAKTVTFGFTEIEALNPPDSTITIEAMMAYCSEIGIKPIAGGIRLTEDTTELRKKLDELAKMNLKFAVAYWPWMVSAPFKPEDCVNSSRILNFMGKICRDEYNITLCWHNHNHEFVPMSDGILPFDYMMNNTDPNLVKCEMDVYWVAKGGADPVEMLKKYSGRYAILHLKDMNAADSSITCVGSGMIDFPAIMKEAKIQGIKHFFVEYDKVEDGLGCLQTAGPYLKGIDK